MSSPAPDTPSFASLTGPSSETAPPAPSPNSTPPTTAELTVTFDHRDTVRLDHQYLSTEVRPGLHGGLVPAYAVTTHVVDRAARATRETPDIGLPTIADTRTTTERLEASLARTPLNEVATAIDPNAQQVGATARRPLADLHANASHDPVAKAALDVNARRAARTALINPPAELVELAGTRPPATNPNRPQ